ncbi:hypothetical protein BDY24DRAFT_23135 [Mrakia frigida]|uniref:uncharacterized protein n=1 Tax=Mrakia frigida TaxID=29902 RepID=UPI003FCC0E59
MTRHSDTLTSQLTAERLTSHQLRALLSTKDDADRARREEENEVVRTVNVMRSDIRTIRSEGQNVGREVLDQRRDKELEELMVKLESDLARGRQENSALKAEHRLHSKSFLLQIEYYKKKFTRENTFRNDLSMQKAYLLILIGKLSRQFVLLSSLSLVHLSDPRPRSWSLSQTRVNSAIAQMGYPGPRPVGPPPRRSFKSVALAVLMIVRTRTYAKNWKETSKINTAFREAAIRATEGRNERPQSSNSASNRSR